MLKSTLQQYKNISYCKYNELYSKTPPHARPRSAVTVRHPYQACTGKTTAELPFGSGFGAYSVVRCIRAGSAIRVATIDGNAVDISPLRHSFIGENQHSGYGEVMLLPALNLYYRHAEKLSPAKYSMNLPISYPNLSMGASFVHAMLTLKLKRYVEALAALDCEEYGGAVPDDIPVPTELLHEMKNNYNPDIDIRLVEQWYKEGVKENA